VRFLALLPRQQHCFSSEKVDAGLIQAEPIIGYATEVPNAIRELWLVVDDGGVDPRKSKKLENAVEWIWKSGLRLSAWSPLRRLRFRRSAPC
jgi:hypothetical protein